MTEMIHDLTPIETLFGLYIVTGVPVLMIDDMILSIIWLVFVAVVGVRFYIGLLRE